MAARPYTSSPGFNRLQNKPAFTMTPLTSKPGMNGKDWFMTARSPSIILWSLGLMEQACTLQYDDRTNTLCSAKVYCYEVNGECVPHKHFSGLFDARHRPFGHNGEHLNCKSNDKHGE